MGETNPLLAEFDADLERSRQKKAQNPLLAEFDADLARSKNQRSKPAPDASLPGWVESGIRALPLGLGAAAAGYLGTDRELAARARSGQTAKDAATDEGLLDRAGSYLERGGQTLFGGFKSALSPAAPSLRADARAMSEAANAPVSGDVSWEDVKANPSLANIGSFVVNRSLESAPGMGLAAVPVAGAPLYAVSNTGSIAQQRAQNDGREDPTFGDIAAAAPAGIASAALEKIGIGGILGATGKSAATRIGKAAATEAVTEFGQSSVEYAGGTAGTDKGFRLDEMLDQGLAGAVAGAGMGGTLRGGGEIIAAPFNRRAVAAGKTEKAVADVVISPDDEASPIPTETIAAGKAATAVAMGGKQADGILDSAGLPTTGKRVSVTLPDGKVKTGTITDAFDEDVDGERATGAVFQFDDGTKLREHFDTLADAGVVIREAGPLAEADANDAALAAMAQNAIAAASEAEPQPVAVAAPVAAPAAPAPTSTVAPSTFRMPVANARVSSKFGARHAPKKGASTMHGGIDFAVPIGTDVAAAAGGRVVSVGWDKKGGGNFVKIDHGKGLVTSYAHLKGATVKVGDTVESGQRVGLSGNTGNSTGPHLHFVARVNGKAVDPETLFGSNVSGGDVSGPVSGDVPQNGTGKEPVFQPEAIKFSEDQPIERAPALDQQERGAPIPVRAEEKADVAVTSNGREVPVRYGVVELGSLIASNDGDGRANPAYPQELQPRDRSRGISQAQITSIAGNLNPRLLGRTAKASDGAPIIAPDGVVESGNGRTLALRQAYANGGEKVDAYRQMIEQEGFDTTGMTQPVLVRIREGDMALQDVQAFTREANARDTLDMSGTEQAMADAAALDGGMLDLYRGGDIDAGANRDFVRRFLQGAVSSPNDFAKLIDSNGQMSQAAVSRVRGAMLAKAYDNAGLVEQAVESTDTEVKSIIAALTDVSGQWSQLREAVKAGQVDPDMDITENVNEAVSIVDRARREGKKVADLVNQRDIFSGSTVAPMTEAVLRLLFARPDFSRPIGRERMARALSYYATEAMKAQPGGASLFGDLPKVEPGSILDLARVKQSDGQADTGPDLLTAAAEAKPAEPAGLDTPDARVGNARSGGESVPQDGGDQAGQSGEVSAPDVAAPDVTGGDLQGDKIKGEWVKFADDSGSLNIPRAEMPQIKAEHRGAMVNFLNARGIEHAEETIPADSLKPTQAEFSTKKVEKAKEYEGGDRAILISSDNHVVDGHHQWLAKRDNGEDIRAIRLKAPIKDVLATVAEFPSAETAAGATTAKPEAAAEPVSNRDELPRPTQQRIEDFGEKLVGARKDVWSSYKDRLSSAQDVDVAAEPLSKSWPEPDYEKLIEGGADPYMVAWIHAARDEIPTKPQKPWRLKGWVNDVNLLRSTANDLLAGDIDAGDVKMRMLSADTKGQLRDLQGRVDLYMEVGHSKSLKGLSFGSRHYMVYRGEKNVTKWVIEKRAKSSAFSNWPREIAIGDSRDEALSKFKKAHSEGGLDKKTPTVVRFDIYSRRSQPGFWIGKKIGRDYVDLKRFDTAREARNFKISAEGYAELIAELDRFKDIPPERKEVNSPRIGINHRDGADVTPEAFSEAFGFRGVQFGNYVEADRRRTDLNQAYDALMDLAGVLGIPAKSLSLNGQLGLAFGARGKGGVNAAAAHYEPGTVVINLTKGSGAGSLAHEWWHSLDNYFSKMAGQSGYMTQGGAKIGTGVRGEMIDAFKSVMSAIRATALKQRSTELDKRRTKTYWSTEIEMSARSFESYIIAKLKDEQFSNDYLANIVPETAFNLENGYPYLVASEVPAVRSAFDDFFRAIEVEETPQGMRLYSRPDTITPAAEIRGQSIGVRRINAMRWYRDNLVGSKITAAYGKVVEFINRGGKKTLQNKGDRLLSAIPAIPDIIANGRVVHTAPGTMQGVKAIHWIAAPVMIDGKEQTVAVMLREQTNGIYQYDITEAEFDRARKPGGAASEMSSIPALEGARSGLNLFLYDGEINQNQDISPTSDATADLRARMAALGIQDRIALRVSENMGAMVAGTFNPRSTLQDGKMMRGLITVALNSPQPRDITLNHESVHAMRSLGLFRTDEWSALTRRAQNDLALMKSIKRRYPDLSADAQAEEAIADMFAGWVRAKNLKGLPARAFDRILSFISSLRSWMNGNGWASAESVMRAMDSGRLASRESRARVTSGEANSLFEEPEQPKKTMTDAQRAELDARQQQSMARRGGQQGLGDQEGGLFSSERDQGTLFSIVADGESQRVPARDLYEGHAGALTDMMDAMRGNGGPLTDKAVKAWENVRTKVQDRFYPLLKLQKAVERDLGKPLEETANPYLGEELMTGRIGARMEALNDEVIEPLFDAMEAEGVSVDDLETYLYARHAPERNARIAEINPEFKDGGGSGMTDIEAAAIMNRIRKADKMEAMERLAARVDEMLDASVKSRVEAGLMSEADLRQWRENYQFYVPLRGKAEVEGMEGLPAVRGNMSSGITVKGKESKRAFGRRSRADSPLAYSILQAQEAIARSETNKVAREFYELAKIAPDPAFWTIDKVERRPLFNKASGQVEYRNESRISAEDAPYTVTAKIDGVEHRITMNRDNPEAIKLATAMRNLTAQKLGWLVQIGGKVNRFLSMVNTSLNPEFVVTNALRDIQAASITLNAQERDGLVRGMVKDYSKALVASMKGSFGKQDGEWGKWYREFMTQGGRVYFNQFEDLDTIKTRIEKQMKLASDRAAGRISLKRGFHEVLQFVENANGGVENAVRLSAYKNAREAGMSMSQAASLAKNLTVNFNRRGEWGAGINAAYLFFNASVQGSATIIGAAKSKRVQKLLGSIVIAGAVVEMMNAMISGDDDDGESYWDKVSSFDKSRNIVLMMPGGEGKFIKIPMPYGYNAFFNLGRGSAEIARRGGEGWKGSVGDILTGFIDAFNPIGGTESLLNLIAPTLIDPLVDLQRNRDFADRPIMPEQSQYGPQEPDAQRYFGSVAPHWKAVTDFLTDMTGGDKIVPGAIDVSPETLEYLQGVGLGAAGQFFDRLLGLGGKLIGADPEAEISANDFPFYRKVIGDTPRSHDKSAFYDRINEVETALDRAKGYAEREDEDGMTAYVLDNEKLFEMEAATKQARKDMREIRKAKGKNQLAHELGKIDDATYRSEATVFKSAEDMVVQGFNAQWNAVMKAEAPD